MKTLIAKMRNGIDLTSSDINYAMSMLLSDSTEDGMKSDFLKALHDKGESVEEIVAFVQNLIDRAIDPLIDPKNLSGPMLDVCGTGGAGRGLFYISPPNMFVLAAGGGGGGGDRESSGTPPFGGAPAARGARGGVRAAPPRPVGM